MVVCVDGLKFGIKTIALNDLGRWCFIVNLYVHEPKLNSVTS